LRGRAAGGDLDYRTLVPRAAFDGEHAADVVRPICDDVRHRGAEAIRAYGEKFDGVAVDPLRVPAGELGRALAELDPAVREAFEEEIRRGLVIVVAESR